jgi:cholera toxin transcriptional activator
VNVVPVAKERPRQQQLRDHKQSDGFRRVDRGALAPRCGISLGGPYGHSAILAPRRLAEEGWLARESAGRIPDATLRPGQPGRLSSQVMAEKRTIRFGAFALDLAAGELRKSGMRLRLQGQPFQVLVLLLERAGEVVTREELRQSLWPSDTFVDFDHSLNTAINKLRDTLGDSASSPRYIETLSRRGYRFIAPVDRNEPAERDVGRQSPDRQHWGGQASVAQSEASSQPSVKTAPDVHPELDIPLPDRAVPRVLFALIQIMYLAFYLAALFRLHAVQALADSYLPFWSANILVIVLILSAGAGIPLRCYLISAVGFDYQRLGETFRRIFPFVLALDELWAVAPFLLIQKIGLGGAFAVSAALLYVPFSERTLIRMAYLQK